MAGLALLLLVFLRLFVLHPFVVPTGAMAPTIYGSHFDLTCSDCGYAFAVGADTSGAALSMPICPNCQLPQAAPRLRLVRGDGLLAYVWGAHARTPRRWDVWVFRNPNDPSQNYVKRVAGLPGETVEIVGGDVTIDARVVQKPDATQESMWMLVHDTRYRPTRPDWQPRWAGGKEWKASGRGFLVEGAPEGGRETWLAYRHRGPTGSPENIHDFNAYNTGTGLAVPAGNVCTDLALRTAVTARDPQTVVVVEIRAYKDRFRFRLAAPGAEGGGSTRIVMNGRVVARSPDAVLRVGRPVEVMAASVDHRLMLLVDGRRVAQPVAAEVTPWGDAVYDPTLLTAAERERFDDPSDDEPNHMAAEVRVGVGGGGAAIGYLRLVRDVYYTNERMMPLSNSRTGPGRGTQGNPLALQEGEYFVLGDNSPRSFDSRLWPLERPVVPRGNMIGRGFFIYVSSGGSRYLD
jgi:signal peptidase I